MLSGRQKKSMARTQQTKKGGKAIPEVSEEAAGTVESPRAGRQGKSVEIRRSSYDKIMENLNKNKRSSIKGGGGGRRIAVVLDKSGEPVTLDGRKLIKGDDIIDDSSMSEDSEPEPELLKSTKPTKPLKFEPRNRAVARPVGPVAGPEMPPALGPSPAEAETAAHPEQDQVESTTPKKRKAGAVLTPKKSKLVPSSPGAKAPRAGGDAKDAKAASPRASTPAPVTPVKSATPRKSTTPVKSPKVVTKSPAKSATPGNTVGKEDKEGSTFLDASDPMVARDLRQLSVPSSNLELLRQSLEQRVQDGALSQEDALKIVQQEEELAKNVRPDGTLSGEQYFSMNDSSAQAVAEDDHLQDDDDELLGSAASEQSASGENAEAGGGMAGPWLVRFPKAGDLCFVALEAESFHMEIKPVDVVVRFIEAVKRVEASAPPVHANLQVLCVRE